MTHVTCRLTAKNRDQLQNPTLDNPVRATFTFFTSAVKVTLLSIATERRAAAPLLLLLLA